MDLQATHLQTDIIKLLPLELSDFNELFAVASDPLIWEMHPQKDRYKKEVFQQFFDSGIASKGAFKIIDKKNNEIIGSTRYYDFSEENSSVAIGYTFLAKKYWARKI